MSNDLTGWVPPPFPPRTIIEGQWCRLEPLVADKHTPDLWRHMQGHDHLWDYLFQTPPQSEAEYHAMLASFEARSDIVPMAVIDKADGQAKGHFWIMEIRPVNGVFEIGSIAWTPAMQRRPMATEVIYLVGDYGFGLGYRRYEWKCNAFNEPSKRAALRFGYSYEGLFRQHMIIKGKSRDTAWFSIIDDEWPACKARFEAWLRPDNFDAKGQQKQALREV